MYCVLRVFICVICASPAVAAGALIPLNSLEGRAIFARAEHKADFFTLVNHFEPQRNGVFCGAASAAIVLNALRVPAAENDTRVPAADGLTLKQSAFVPAEINPALRRYSQMNIFDAPGVKSLSEVLGAAEGGEAPDLGFQLRQLGALLTAHGLRADVHPVTHHASRAAIVTAVSENLSRTGDMILVNYRRDALGKRGGGHVSPLGAYDETSRRFLIMDVNPTRAPFIWVDADMLINAMQTFDTIENRGYIDVGGDD